MFSNRRGNMGMSLFLGVIFFQIIMYVFVYMANGDAVYNDVGSYSGTGEVNFNASTDQDISISDARDWYSGFDISIFGLPSMFNYFYGGIQALLFGIALYGLLRGLS